MKKIALIMDGWKRFFTYAWPAGILQRIQETNEAVNLYIFNSSGDWSWDKDYNIGEYNIYKLPDLNDFDGIILDVNNIHYPHITQELCEIVRNTGKPAISIANELPGMYYVGINNWAAITTMIDHLYQVHQCRRFWFIMGPKDNYENSVRAKALKDFLTAHGLAYQEEDFYYDSYEFSCGYKGLYYMVEHRGGREALPDAVICANDNIAVGVMEAASKMGFRVPEDFCVTGFDNFDKASYYAPKITTVGHIREDVGYCCADLLIRIWNGEHVDRFNYTEPTFIYWDSCGCKNDIIIDHAEHSKGQIMYEIETTQFEEQVLALEYALLNCKSVREILTCIPTCLPAFQCDAMYMVLDDHIHDFCEKQDIYKQSLIQDKKFHVDGYPKTMVVEFAYDKIAGNKGENQTISSLFPMFAYEKGGTDFLFMPLHFRNHTVGYFVIRNAVYLMEKQYLFKVMNVLTSAMENLHEKEKLEYMNKMLLDMSIKDSMTGLYNRMGFRKLACSLFEEKKRKGENLFILFLDMDRLKYINDNYGHKYGDYAIRILAGAISKHFGEPSIPVRNGGDEFIIIHKQVSWQEYQETIQKMREEVAKEAEQFHLPFALTFSIGAVETDMNTNQTLDDYIRIADEIMYQEKIQKKANRA